MASGKLSPRQKMINMMYLVLTALLAMNVSKEVINAFKNVNSSITKTMGILSSKNTATYSALKDALEDPQQKQKAAIWKPVADKIGSLSNSLISDIETYKTEMKKASKLEMKDGEEVFKYDDLNAGTRIMIKQKKGHEIYNKVKQYKKEVLEVLASANVDAAMREQLLKDVKAFEAALPAQLEIPKKSSYGKAYSQDAEGWAQSSFYMTPSIAGITVLTKVQNDIKSSEGMLSDYCLNQLGKVKLIYDKFAAVASANTTYCMPGDAIEITAGVGAFNESAKPTFNINGSSVAINAEGVAVYKTTATGGAGERSINVNIGYTTPGGEKKSENRVIKYTIGQPSGAALMLDKMNVFYIGLPNPITVSSGTGAEKTKLSASGGGITLQNVGPNKYVVRATTPGKANITINSDGKTTSYEFRVKSVPSPLCTIGGTIKGGKIKKGMFGAQQGLMAILENFDFEAKFDVIEFTVVYNPKSGDPVDLKCNGPRFSEAVLNAIRNCKPKDGFYIENVKVKGPDGTTRSIPGLSVQII